MSPSPRGPLCPVPPPRRAAHGEGPAIGTRLCGGPLAREGPADSLYQGLGMGVTRWQMGPLETWEIHNCFRCSNLLRFTEPV